MCMLLIWREIKKKTGSREVRKSGRPEDRKSEVGRGQWAECSWQWAVGSRQEDIEH